MREANPKSEIRNPKSVTSASKSARRVLLLNQYYAPDEAATAQMLADLGEGLAAAGFDVSAVCCDRSYADPSRRYARRETIGGVDVRRVRSSGFGRGSKAGRIADYLTFLVGAKLRLLFGPRADVVIALSTPPMVALLGTLCARLRGARAIFWSMDVYPDIAYELGAIREGSIAGRVVDRLARLTHSLPDRVVALGESMAKRLEATGASRVTVIHNWADGDAIRPRPTAGHPLRAAWGWGDRFVVMYSGNMGLGHEFETTVNGVSEFGSETAISDFGFRISNLGDQRREPASGSADVEVRSASEIRNAVDSQIRNSKFEIRNASSDPKSEIRDVLLSFVGGGPRRKEVEERLRELAIANVELRPYVERAMLAESLTAPDVHLVTMRERMSGLLVPSKIYGILAAGKPTIYVGPAEGEIFQILTEGRCGTRVAIGDAKGFAAAVEKYRSDPELVATEGRRARELFDRRFAKAIAMEKWREVVEGR